MRFLEVLAREIIFFGKFHRKANKVVYQAQGLSQSYNQSWKLNLLLDQNLRELCQCLVGAVNE
jgi:hypothetical protein